MERMAKTEWLSKNVDDNQRSARFYTSITRIIRVWVYCTGTTKMWMSRSKKWVGERKRDMKKNETKVQ